MTKRTKREDRNQALTKQLKWAMDLNPSLNMVETLLFVVKSTRPKQDVESIPDSELLDILVQYNKMRIMDASREHMRSLLR